MAAGDITNEFRTRLPGIDLYGCTVVNNGTTVVTIQTGLSKILNVVATFAEEPANPTTSELWATHSGGVVSLDCAAASGAVKVDLLVFGFRG